MGLFFIRCCWPLLPLEFHVPCFMRHLSSVCPLLSQYVQWNFKVWQSSMVWPGLLQCSQILPFDCFQLANRPYTDAAIEKFSPWFEFICCCVSSCTIREYACRTFGRGFMTRILDLIALNESHEELHQFIFFLLDLVLLCLITNYGWTI